MRRILVPLLSAGYGNLPFYDLMRRLQGDFEFVVLSHEVLAECQGFEAHLIPPLVAQSGLRGAYRHQKALAQQARQIQAELKPDAVLLSGDFQGLLYHLARLLPSVVLQITSDFVSPADRAAVMIGNSPKRLLVTRLMALMSKLTGLSLVGYVTGKPYLPHGLALGKTWGAALAGVEQSAIKGAFADRFCMNGDFYAEKYAEAGINPQKMIVTGSPTDDWLAEFIQQDSPSLRPELGIPAHAKLISFFLQPYNENFFGKGVDYPREVAEITQDLAKDEDVFVVVKQHPRHRPDEYAHLAALERVKVLPDQDYSGDDFNNRLIASSELVITRTSTVGLNAMALGVPLLTYERYKQPIETDFRYIEGSLHLLAGADIAAEARALLHNPEKRQAVLAQQRQNKGRYMQLDGHSSERIGAVLASLSLEEDRA